MLKVCSVKSLGLNVCQVVSHRIAGGDYLMLSGSNRLCQLLFCEGYSLSPVADCNKWVWSTVAKPIIIFLILSKGKFIQSVCSEDGIVGHQPMFRTVHELCKERYAFRYNS